VRGDVSPSSHDKMMSCIIISNISLVHNHTLIIPISLFQYEEAQEKLHQLRPGSHQLFVPLILKMETVSLKYGTLEVKLVNLGKCAFLCAINN